MRGPSVRAPQEAPGAAREHAVMTDAEPEDDAAG